jgi:hypothetical protein
MVTQEILWNYADDLLSLSERKAVEAALLQDDVLQKQLAEILQEKKLFSQLSLEKPSLDFASNVLSSWQAEQSFEPVVQKSKYVFKIMIGLFIALTISFLYMIFSTPSINSDPIIEVPSNLPWQSISISIAFLVAIVAVKFVEKIWLYRQFRLSSAM